MIRELRPLLFKVHTKSCMLIAIILLFFTFVFLATSEIIVSFSLFLQPVGYSDSDSIQLPIQVGGHELFQSVYIIGKYSFPSTMADIVQSSILAYWSFRTWRIFLQALLASLEKSTFIMMGFPLQEVSGLLLLLLLLFFVFFPLLLQILIV